MMYEVRSAKVLYVNDTKEAAAFHLLKSKEYYIVERAFTTEEFCQKYKLSVDVVITALDRQKYVSGFLTDLGLSHDKACDLPEAIKKFYGLKKESSV